MQKIIFSRYIGMIVLNLDAEQDLIILPIREKLYNGSAGTLYAKFTDEQTKNVYTREVQSRVNQGDLLVISFDDLDFLYENAFFNIKVYFNVNGEVIYKYTNGIIKVHDMEFKSTNDAKSYIDHISR
jgi:hypothetical protein